MSERSLATQSTANYVSLCRKRGRIHARKSTIYHQGDSGEHFYRVNSGVVMVYRLLEDSQRQISGFYTTGDFFGMTSTDTHADTAITITTANIAALSMTDVSASRDLQRDLFSTTCGQLEAAQKLITTLTKKTASQKVASFLIMLADGTHIKEGDIDVKLPMSRLDIADYLGLSIETVSRRLTEFKTKGVIKLPNRNMAQICELTQLQTMAGAA